MSLRLALISLKLHRFELTTAVVLIIVAGLWALAIAIRLDGLGVPPECLPWLASDWTEAPADCQPQLQRYIANLYDDGPLALLTGQSFVTMDPFLPEGAPVWSVMTILPLAAGLLAGVPIVGRELEAGTAQTAWSLDAVRARWLLRRTWPIALVVGLAMTLTAIATEQLAQRELVTTSLALPILGFHGLPVMARLLAAFGLGLLAGALVPRALPALVAGVLLVVVLSFGVSQAFDAWLDAQPSLPRVESEARRWTFDGEWQQLGPDGRLLTEAEARALVPDKVEALDVGLAQPAHFGEWLEERGFESVPMGIPESEAVAGWFPLDVLLYSGAGILGIVAAVVVVDRRRPTT